MGIKCTLGIHEWSLCKCSRCGKANDKNHDWSGCKCSKCGKTRDEGHDWSGCKCSKCNKTRNEGHDWTSNCEKCARCGARRKNGHSFNQCECRNCTRSLHNWSHGKCVKCNATLAETGLHILPDDIIKVVVNIFPDGKKVGLNLALPLWRRLTGIYFDTSMYLDTEIVSTDNFGQILFAAQLQYGKAGNSVILHCSEEVPTKGLFESSGMPQNSKVTVATILVHPEWSSSASVVFANEVRLEEVVPR